MVKDDGRGMVWCKCEKCHCTNIEYRDKVTNPDTWICGECVIRHD